MSNVIDQTGQVLLRYKTDVSRTRPSSLPTNIFLILTFVLGNCLLLSAMHAGEHRMIAGMQIAIGLSLMAYSCYFAWWLYKQSKTSYELEFFSDGISLRVRESNGRLLRISMSYPEMDFVEYFTPRDRESLVFHSLDGRLIEVPVDRMDQDRVHAIDLLRERGIKIERI